MILSTVFTEAVILPLTLPAPVIPPPVPIVQNSLSDASSVAPSATAVNTGLALKSDKLYVDAINTDIQTQVTANTAAITANTTNINHKLDATSSALLGLIDQGSGNVAITTVAGKLVLNSSGLPSTITLKSIALAGPTNVNEGSTGTFVATGTYSDNSTAVLSGALFTSSDATQSFSGTVLTVPSNAVQGDTRVATITASFSGVTNSITITINDTTPAPVSLVSISLTGANSMNEGTSASYTLTATYSDASNGNVTSSAAYTLSDNSSTFANGVLTVPADSTVGDGRNITITSTYQNKTTTKIVAIIDTTMATTTTGGTYSLTEASTVSQGIFRVSDGALIKTLPILKNQPAGMNIPVTVWDYTDDNNVALSAAPAGTYEQRILTFANSAGATWEGVIGNTSASFTNNVWKSLCLLSDLDFINSDVYAAMQYTEGAAGLVRSVGTVQSPSALIPSNIRDGFTRVRADNTFVYGVCNNSGWDHFAGTYVGRVGNTFYNPLPWLNGTSNNDTSTSGARLGCVSVLAGATAIDANSSSANTVAYAALSTANRITGFSTNATYMAVARAGQNHVQFYGLALGQLVGTLNVSSPGACAFDKDNNFWVISAGAVQKYNVVNAGGSTGVSSLLNSMTNTTNGFSVNGTNGSLNTSSNRMVSDYLPVVPGDTLYSNVYFPFGYYYDSNKVALATGAGGQWSPTSSYLNQGVVPTTAAFFRFSEANTGQYASIRITANRPATGNGGTLTFNLALTLSGITSALGLDANATSDMVIVADGGTSQQVKGYNVAGVSQWTYGQAGGHPGTNSIVTNDKFWFVVSDPLSYNAIDRPKIGDAYTFVRCVADGSFWVSDTCNCRIMHFTAARTYVEQISHLGDRLNLTIDGANRARVFSQYLEFQVSDSPLQPGDQSLSASPSWKLVRNWGVGVPLNHRLRNVCTHSANGRTYGMLGDDTNQAAPMCDTVELVSTGNLRFTGIRLDQFGNGKWSTMQYTSAGTYRHPYINYDTAPANWNGGTGFAQMACEEKGVVSYDSNNNPVYGPATTVYSFLSKLTVGGEPSINSPKLDMTQVYTLANGNYVTYQPNTMSTMGAYHIGIIKPGTTTTSGWLMKAHRGVTVTDDSQWGTFTENPSYGGLSGGNIVVDGKVIIVLFNGQNDLKLSNKYDQFSEDCLFVQRFGATNVNAPLNYATYGNAGNSGALVFGRRDVNCTFTYAPDESAHDGLARWRIDNQDKILRSVASLDGSGHAILTTTKTYVMDITDASYAVETGYNRIYQTVAAGFTNLVDTTGVVSTKSMGLVVAGSNGNINNKGYTGSANGLSSGTNISNLFVGSGSSPFEYDINGLDGTKNYTLEIWGSRAGVSDVRVAGFTINGLKKTLSATSADSLGNTNSIIFTGVPPTSGTIKLFITCDSGVYGYFSALRLTEV